MPLDAAFDPLAAAGLTQGSDGTWSAAPAAPAATTAAGTPPAPGRPASEPDLIPVYGPDGSWRGYDRPPGWKPSTAPGPAGSGVVIPSTTQGAPSTAAPALVAPPPEAKPPAEAQPPPPKGAVPAATRKETPPPPPAQEMPPPPPVEAPAAPAPSPAATTPAPQAPPGPPPGPAFDPLAAAGLVQAPNGSWTTPENAPAPAQAPTQGPPLQPGPDGKPPPYQPPDHLHNQPWYQGLVAGVGQSAMHGATMGFDEVVAPLPAAIYDHLVHGIPFEQAYTQNVQAMRQVRKDYEEAHPYIGLAGEIAGGLAPIVATGGLYGAAEVGAGALARTAMAARNVGLNAAQGALAGGGMTEGDLTARLHGAEWGGGVGAGLGATAGVVGKGVGRVYRALRPGTQIDQRAGQSLLEATKGKVPAVEAPPIPGMQRNAAQATTSPGLSAMVRKSNAINDEVAKAEEAANNAAVRTAATEPTQGTRLASGRMGTPAGSERVVEGMQAAHDVIKQEEARLWSKPALAKRLDLPTVKKTVDRVIANMPVRFRNTIAKTPDLQSALEELANLASDTTLADLNSIRSDMLALARSLPREQGMAKKVASDLAKAVLEGIEKNPALRNDPVAWADYVRARAFTAKMWDVFGHDAFQNMLKANKFGNAGVDARTAAGRIFGFGDKTAGERVPGGVNAIGDMLKDVQRQWAALRTSGVTGAGQLPPGVAQAARVELLQGARDFIVNSMLDDAESTVRDLNGQQNLMFNRVSDFIEKNTPWIKQSGLFNQDQLDLWKRIADAAKQVARPESLRGGKGSETYERLLKNPDIADLFGAAGIAKLGGAALGHMLGPFGPVFDVLLGEKAGQALFQRLNSMPNEQLKERIEAALRDPDIAHDLMQRATVANAQRMNPKTIRWVRSFLATEPFGQVERVIGSSPASQRSAAHAGAIAAQPGQPRP